MGISPCICSKWFDTNSHPRQEEPALRSSPAVPHNLPLTNVLGKSIRNAHCVGCPDLDDSPQGAAGNHRVPLLDPITGLHRPSAMKPPRLAAPPIRSNFYTGLHLSINQQFMRLVRRELTWSIALRHRDHNRAGPVPLGQHFSRTRSSFQAPIFQDLRSHAGRKFALSLPSGPRHPRHARGP